MELLLLRRNYFLPQDLKTIKDKSKGLSYLKSIEYVCGISLVKIGLFKEGFKRNNYEIFNQNKDYLKEESDKLDVFYQAYLDYRSLIKSGLYSLETLTNASLALYLAYGDDETVYYLAFLIAIIEDNYKMSNRSSIIEAIIGPYFQLTEAYFYYLDRLYEAVFNTNERIQALSDYLNSNLSQIIHRLKISELIKARINLKETSYYLELPTKNPELKLIVSQLAKFDGYIYQKKENYIIASPEVTTYLKHHFIEPSENYYKIDLSDDIGSDEYFRFERISGVYYLSRLFKNPEISHCYITKILTPRDLSIFKSLNNLRKDEIKQLINYHKKSVIFGI